MSRETSPYVVGDYWLDKRRDGISAEVWQIARYAEKSRSVVYRSTRKRSLEDAKAVIHAYVETERAKRPQRAEDAEVLPHLFLYWREHGAKTTKPGVIAGSLRAFIGFLMQDEVGVRVRFSDLNPMVFKRFVTWRMQPHAFEVIWEKKRFPVDSQGVKGESVQRNLDDVRAALNHAAGNARVPYSPKVPSVPTELRSPARDVRVSLAALGAMIGFASQNDKPETNEDENRDFRRWLWLMIATAARPEAALKFDPALQWSGDVLDLHPPGAKRTKKRNPVVPVVDPFAPILKAWADDRSASPKETATKSRRTAWRTMRRALELPANVIPKTIRHTIATELRRRGVHKEDIGGLLGHIVLNKTSEVYAKYDPTYLAEAKAALTSIFEEVQRHSEAWTADHLRTKPGNGPVKVVPRAG